MTIFMGKDLLPCRAMFAEPDIRLLLAHVHNFSSNFLTPWTGTIAHFVQSSRLSRWRVLVTASRVVEFNGAFGEVLIQRTLDPPLQRLCEVSLGSFISRWILLGGRCLPWGNTVGGFSKIPHAFCLWSLVLRTSESPQCRSSASLHMKTEMRGCLVDSFRA
jgi:hypothetical protein